MALNLTRLVQTAVRTATTVGVTAPVTISRGPTPDPITGTVSGQTVSRTVRAVVSEPTAQQRAADAAWSTVTTALYVAAADLGFTPQRGDTVTVGGRTGHIVALRTDAPAGAAISYTIGVGA